MKEKRDKILEAAKKKVANCKICLGSPKEVDFSIPEFKGKVCDTCGQITYYENQKQ